MTSAAPGPVTRDVVIPTLRAREMLARCLRALGDDPSPKRVIVVDNASGGGTAELVQGNFPDVTLLELPENAGFGRAVNAGVRAGDGDAIVLVNDDVLVEPGFVDAIVAPLARPEVGMVAGLTTIPGSGLVDAFGIQLDRGLAAYNRGRHGPVPAAGARPAQVVAGGAAAGDRTVRGRAGRLAMPSGGAAAYRRAAFEAVGGFDGALFAYGEDVDLGLRLRAAGWLPAEAPDARGVHLGGATAGLDSPLQRELAGFARGFLLRRYGILRSAAAPHALAIDALVVAWGLARHHTLTPLRARVRGWRAAAHGGSRPLPPDVIDPTITVAEAVRRLRAAR